MDLIHYLEQAFEGFSDCFSFTLANKGMIFSLLSLLFLSSLHFLFFRPVFGNPALNFLSYLTSYIVSALISLRSKLGFVFTFGRLMLKLKCLSCCTQDLHRWGSKSCFECLNILFFSRSTHTMLVGSKTGFQSLRSWLEQLRLSGDSSL